ncbi:MAG TPA: SCO family protein [Kofleriaceae bacterium]
MQTTRAQPGEQAAPDIKAESARGGDEILTPPPTSKGNDVKVDEKLGAKVPVDATFRDQDGKLVTLGDVLAGELPTILTFNYSDCPMLCNLQLNGLTAVLPAIAEKHDDARFRVGTQFRIITIDLEPNESLDKLRAMKNRYVERLPEAQRAAARTGWTYLAAATPGDGAAIRRVADAVGFSYTYIQERAEWAHPAALIFVSVKGTVTRYVYGIEFPPAVMRESIIKAGTSEPATAVGFMNRCYHFDPDANNESRAGVMALRIGAAGFVVLLLSVFGVMHVIRKSRPGVNRA